MAAVNTPAKGRVCMFVADKMRFGISLCDGKFDIKPYRLYKQQRKVYTLRRLVSLLIKLLDCPIPLT